MRTGTIDETINALDGIIAHAVEAGSYLAVFPAMYRSVTSEMRRANGLGFFEDAERLERLVVTFAGRYIDALEAHRTGSTATASWEMAFAAAGAGPRRSILQHLLLGMNAHINLDLGIAAARTAEGPDLPALYGDFLKVNEVLFAMVDQLQVGLNEVSPWMGLVDRVGLGIDEGFMRMGLRASRDRAWRFAEHLVSQGEESRDARVGERDEEVARLGGLIGNRFSLFNIVNTIIRLRESRDVAAIVDAFTRQTVDLELVASRVSNEPGEPSSGDFSLDRRRGRG